MAFMGNSESESTLKRHLFLKMKFFWDHRIYFHEHISLSLISQVPRLGPHCGQWFARRLKKATSLLCWHSFLLKGSLKSTAKRWASPVAQSIKNLPPHEGDTGDTVLIPGSERSFGGGNGPPLQYSCLGNSMGRGAWRATVHGVAKSPTWLSATQEMSKNTMEFLTA